MVDQDEPRRDPVLGAVLVKLQARRPNCAPLAGKSTLDRLEHAPVDGRRYLRIAHDPAAIETLFVGLFLDTHSRAPARITLEPDTKDDPIHERQEGRFFRGPMTFTLERIPKCQNHLGDSQPLIDGLQAFGWTGRPARDATSLVE